MDIEGGEYESLLATDDQLLKCFRIIVLELHRLDDAESPERFERGLGPLLRKLVRHFVCVHAHPNNCCGDFVLEGSGLNIPRVLEVTLLRRDRFDRPDLGQPQPPMLPHPQDLDWNARQQPPLFLSDAWLSTPKGPESRIKVLQAMLDYTQFNGEQNAWPSKRRPWIACSTYGPTLQWCRPLTARLPHQQFPRSNSQLSVPISSVAATPHRRRCP